MAVATMRLAKMRSTALRDHVTDVIGMRAEKEVTWPNAYRVVAPMTDFKAIGDRTVFECERSPVGYPTVAYPAVAFGVTFPKPFPASIAVCFVYAPPETLRCSASKSGAEAMTHALAIAESANIEIRGALTMLFDQPSTAMQASFRHVRHATI